MDINKQVQDITRSGEKFSYMMLSRLQSDCKYYLGNGGRHKKHLWAGDEQDHIDVMKGIWNSFSDDKKPEWLTWDDILDYETKMVEQKIDDQGFEGYQVPEEIKRFATEICEAFNIKGLSDPMYIANVTAVTLEVGDGCHNFYHKSINKNNLDELIERFKVAYKTCIDGNYELLENIVSSNFNAK